MLRFYNYVLMACCLLVLFQFWGVQRGHECVNHSATRVHETSPWYAIVSASFSPPIPVHVVIHAVTLGNWRLIISDMLFSLERHGLYEVAHSITVCAAGTTSQIDELRELCSSFGTRFDRVKVLQTSNSTTNYWEFLTINYVQTLASQLEAKNQPGHVLYLHTKGLYEHNGDFVSKWFWRKWMEDFVIKRHREARALLSFGYDTVGCNAVNLYIAPHEEMKVNPLHAWHYSGNFWWATTGHLASLPKLPTDHPIGDPERCKAENFVLAKLPEMCAGVLGRSEHVHIYHNSQIPSTNQKLHGRIIVT